MTATELKFYEAGIKDANETRSIVFAYQSKRATDLFGELKLGISEECVKCLDAYNSGVAHEINRQTELEF
jgi:hypothetical protein